MSARSFHLPAFTREIAMAVTTLRLSLLVFGLVAAVGVMAQTTRPQHFAEPSVEQIAGKACDSPSVTINVGEQDAQTLFYTGRIFARTHCHDENLWYQGCAEGSWDPTGTQVTYKILWQE